MNYYYELLTDYLIFGQNKGRYLVMPDCSPATGGELNYHLHDVAMKASHRVWLENANGVTLIKNSTKSHITAEHFMWVKLRAISLK